MQNIVLTIYPQCLATTMVPAFDAVANSFSDQHYAPRISIIRSGPRVRGYTVDRLKTLKQTAEGKRAIFMGGNGASYQYIPGLNDDTNHINFLAEFVSWETEWQQANHLFDNFRGEK
jgi:protoheme ferro-lyase